MQQSARFPSRSSQALPRMLRLIGPALALALTLSMSAIPQAQAAPSLGTTSAQTAAASVAVAGKVRPARAHRNRIIRIARSKAGTPYRWGATGPGSFDCSGYTSWVFRKAGRNIPRTSRQQAAAAKRIPRSNRRRGDLVFFHNQGRVYHVGIYAGRGFIWSAPSTGKRVSRQRIWTNAVFYGRFRR